MVPQVAKLMRKERLPEAQLCQTAHEVVSSTFRAGEADLGGWLFKKRVARTGQGKSGGYRMIVAYRAPQTERVLFVYAFAKNAASTLTPQGREALAKAAGAFLKTNDVQVTALMASGDIREVYCNAIEQD